MNGSLFLGNYDQAIFIANIERAILTDGAVTGALKRKCIDVAPRAVHYLREQDGVVLYAPLGDDFRAYVETLYGFSPRVIAPAGIDPAPDVPLSLVDALRADAEALACIRDEGAERDWMITSFIPHESVFQLASLVRRPVFGLPESLVRRGHTQRLNDKAEFQRVCRSLDIPVPDSIHSLGWDEVIADAEEMFDRAGGVMLRQSRTNGGLGNVKITPADLKAAGADSVRAFLDARVGDPQTWASQIVLVEPLLPVEASPSTLLHLEGGKTRFITHALQLLRGQAYVGCRNPSGTEPELLDRLIEWSFAYAEHAAHLSWEGYLGIDWGVLRDGGLVAFESNARFGGQNHVLAIARRLRHDSVNAAKFQSCDALPVSPGTTLQDVLDGLAHHRLAWDARRGEGIVVSIPPANGYMGYVAIADTERRLAQLTEGMEGIASRLHALAA